MSSGRIGTPLIVEGEVRIDMRYVCPKDEENASAATVYWKKWAAKAIEGGYLAGAGSGLVAEEDEGRVD